MNSSTHSTDLRQELRGDAQKVGGATSERLQSEADARKGAAAEQAKSLSSALEKVAGEMGDDTPNWLKSAFSQGAQSLSQLADTVDQQDSRQLLAKVSGFARDNPATFLAGCAALGFAAARVFRAGEHGGGAADPALYQPSDSAAPLEQSRPAIPLGVDAGGPDPLFQG